MGQCFTIFAKSLQFHMVAVLTLSNGCSDCSRADSRLTGLTNRNRASIFYFWCVDQWILPCCDCFSRQQMLTARNLVTTWRLYMSFVRHSLSGSCLNEVLWHVYSLEDRLSGAIFSGDRRIYFNWNRLLELDCARISRRLHRHPLHNPISTWNFLTSWTQ
jgi:hypothetical protein